MDLVQRAVKALEEQEFTLACEDQLSSRMMTIYSIPAGYEKEILKIHKSREHKPIMTMIPNALKTGSLGRDKIEVYKELGNTPVHYILEKGIWKQIGTGFQSPRKYFINPKLTYIQNYPNVLNRVLRAA